MAREANAKIEPARIYIALVRVENDKLEEQRGCGYASRVEPELRWVLLV